MVLGDLRKEGDAGGSADPRLSETVEGVRPVTVVPADADDDKYFAAALEGEADFVVSGDKHVLEIGQYERIRVLRPRAFLEKIQ